jgi:hypothetical protein
MRCPRPLFGLPVVLVLASSVSASATTSTTWRNTTRAPEIAVEIVSDGSQLSESLRQDVARHPNDFVTFETQSAAMRFIDEHGFEASRETEHRMVESGVFGYWRGKTVVVIPIVASSGRRGL